MKKTIFLSPRSVQFITDTETVNGTVQWTHGVNGIIESFRGVIADNMPELTNDTWKDIVIGYPKEMVNDSIYSYLDQLAIFYFVKIYRAHDWSHCANFDQIKTEIMAILRGTK